MAGRAWRRPARATATASTWLPQVDDEVLVGFLQGDPQLPYVLGGLWNGQDKIPFDYGDGLDGAA